MATRKPEWPEAGDLIIAITEAVTDYNAYAKLGEYDKRVYFTFQKFLHHCQMLQNQVEKSLLEGKNNWSGNFANV